MIYTKLTAECRDQSLNLKLAPNISSGGVNEVLLTVEFSSEWTGFEKTAVFYRTEDCVYHVLLDNDSCLVPKEVLSEAGVFYFGIMGVSTDSVRTSDVLPYSVRKGAVTEATAVSDPTPDIYSQLLSRISALEESGGSGGTGGADGISCTHYWEGTTLTVTSASGTSSADLKGEKGDTGEKGADGYTPQKGVDYFDGETGAAGADGYTPVKGTDYFTEADKTELVNAVLAAMPDGDEVSY